MRNSRPRNKSGVTDGQALALIEKQRGAMRLVAVDAAAAALGLGRNTLTRKLGSSRKGRDSGLGTRDSKE